MRAQLPLFSGEEFAQFFLRVFVVWLSSQFVLSGVERAHLRDDLIMTRRTGCIVAGVRFELLTLRLRLLEEIVVAAVLILLLLRLAQLVRRSGCNCMAARGASRKIGVHVGSLRDLRRLLG